MAAAGERKRAVSAFVLCSGGLLWPGGCGLPARPRFHGNGARRSGAGRPRQGWLSPLPSPPCPVSFLSPEVTPGGRGRRRRSPGSLPGPSPGQALPRTGQPSPRPLTAAPKSRENTPASIARSSRAPLATPSPPPPAPSCFASAASSSPSLRHRVAGVTPAGSEGSGREAEAARSSPGLLGARRRPAVPGPMSVSLVVIRLELAEHSPLPAGFAYSAAGEFLRAAPGPSHRQPGPRSGSALAAAAGEGAATLSAARRRPGGGRGRRPGAAGGSRYRGWALTAWSQRLLFAAQPRRWLRRAPGRPRRPCPPAWRGRAPGSERPSSTSTSAAGR